MGRILLVLAVVVGCGGDDDGDGKADAGGVFDASVADATPAWSLFDTGLYEELGSEVLAANVSPYSVAFPLWADGASKRRWIYLPPGTSIDTSDMDFWVYPEGTRLWKEFSVGDVKVETRLLSKDGPTADDWVAVSFSWNSQQSDAVAVPGGVRNALGTEHDIPSTGDCQRCHGPMPDFVLGYSAIQLDTEFDGLQLAELVAEEWLSEPPLGESPYFPLPDDFDYPSAFGYLHGNCGGCHHSESSVLDNTPAEFRLSVNSLESFVDTPIYLSNVGKAPAGDYDETITSLIEPASRDASAVWLRISTRSSIAMPPLSTEVVDTDGIEPVGDWIDEIPPL